MYLDDIIIFGRSFRETLARVQEVFDRLRQAGLKLKPSKCAFFQKEVEYLGHIIRDGGLACEHGKSGRTARAYVYKGNTDEGISGLGQQL